MKIIKGKAHTAANTDAKLEERLEDIQFNVYKFNNRPKPDDPKKIMIIGTFSEFGCESLGVQYCIPRLVGNNPGFYKIVVGWYGREYLYRHLVDEYWEMKEEHQWLREYVRAFHHESKNLTRLEKKLAQHGNFVPSSFLGNMCLGNTCNECKNFWGDGNYVEKCIKCGSKNVARSLFGDIPTYRKTMTPIPKPDYEMQCLAKKYLRPKSVGVFARARKTWGRNLPPEYYEKLVYKLEEMGYNPIWLGEKQSTLPCPVPRICDFSRMPESKDLELLLAIVSKLEFTVQYWTASTRFAAMMGVPYLLFESPDQICGQGQEGLRMALVTKSPQHKKLVISHYLNVLDNQDQGLKLTEQAIKEMKAGNYDDVVGLVDQPEIIKAQLAGKKLWANI